MLPHCRCRFCAPAGRGCKHNLALANAFVDIRKAHPNSGCASFTVFTVNRFHMQCDYRPEAKDNNSTQSARPRLQQQKGAAGEDCALVEPAGRVSWAMPSRPQRPLGLCASGRKLQAPFNTPPRSLAVQSNHIMQTSARTMRTAAMNHQRAPPLLCSHVRREAWGEVLS